MFQRILVPVDGSQTSTNALVTALQLASEEGGCVRVLHSFDEFNYLFGRGHALEMMHLARHAGEKVLEDALELAKPTGVPADSRFAEGIEQRLGEVVAEEARAWEADLIVIGTHGRHGLGRVLLGSGAEQVIRLAPVPVLAVRALLPRLP